MDLPPLLSFVFDRNGGAAAAPADTAVAEAGQLVWTHAKWEHDDGAEWLTGRAGLPM